MVENSMVDQCRQPRSSFLSNTAVCNRFSRVEATDDSVFVIGVERNLVELESA